MSKPTYILIVILLSLIITSVLWSAARGSLFKVSAPAAKGLVGHWKLDQASNKSTTVTADATPYGNNGTSSGSPTLGGATDQHGQANRATTFTAASSQKVTIGNVGNVKSVAFWAKLNSTTEKILELIDDNTYIHNNAGTITATGFTAPTVYVDGAAASTVSDTNWHYIVVTTGTSVAAASMIIGEANTTYLTGTLADVRVYNRTLSATEVTSLYNSYRPKQAISSLQKGLVGQWKLNQASNKSTTVTADATPYGNNGTSSGSPTLGGATDQHGQASRATTFDGTDDEVNLGTPSILNFGTGNFTISAWIKTTGDFTGSEGHIFSKRSGNGYYFTVRDIAQANAGKLIFYAQGDSFGVVVGNSTVNDNSWHHVVVVRKSTTVEFYKDGSADGAPSQTYGNISNASATAYISSEDGASNRFTGSIADVRVYNRTLSATEVTSLYNSYRPTRQISSLYKGLVLDMPLAQADLKSSTTIADKTPYSQTGTLVGSPTFTTDRKGQANKAMALNGSSQYVDVGTGLNSYTVRSKSFSISFWMKTTSNGADEEIVANADASSPYTGIEFHTISGTLRFDLNQDASKLIRKTTTATVNNGNWRHLVVTYNGNGAASGVTFYIDGTSVSATTNYDNTDADTTSVTNLQIGARDGTTAPFNGSIHSVKVWNRALSAAEVGALYQQYQ